MKNGCVPKQQALDRMAENARELGLDYEPVQIAGFDVVLDKGMPPNTMKFVQPAPVQEPVATLFGSLPVYDTTPPAAQPALKPLTDEQIQHLVDTYVGEPNARYPLDNSDWMNFARAVEAAHGIKGAA
jgi:hypothetical protein